MKIFVEDNGLAHIVCRDGQGLTTFCCNATYQRIVRDGFPTCFRCIVMAMDHAWIWGPYNVETDATD